MHFERIFIYIPAGTNASLLWAIKQRHHSNLILMNFNKRKKRPKEWGKLIKMLYFFSKRWGTWYTILRQNLPSSCNDQFYSNISRYLSLEMPKMDTAEQTDAVMTPPSQRYVNSSLLPSTCIHPKSITKLPKNYISVQTSDSFMLLSDTKEKWCSVFCKRAETQ